MNVSTAPRFPLSNDWINLSFKEIAEKVTALSSAQNLEIHLSRSERKRLYYSIQQAANESTDVVLTFRGNKPELLTRDTMNRTGHCDPTARAAMRLITASAKQRKMILFELGEGQA